MANFLNLGCGSTLGICHLPYLSVWIVGPCSHKNKQARNPCAIRMLPTRPTLLIPQLSPSHKWSSPSSTLTPPSALWRTSPQRNLSLLPENPKDALVPTIFQGGSSISLATRSVAVASPSVLLP
jgi:hypothetical protein